jgi:hypothetical protein
MKPTSKTSGDTNDTTNQPFCVNPLLVIPNLGPFESRQNHPLAAAN